MALPSTVQQAADYADALEQKLQDQAPVTEPVGEEKSSQDVTVDDSVDKLRSRYASLQGKYNAEVPRLHQQTKSLESQVQQLMAENESLRKEMAQREQETPYLTEKDSEAFGEDMVDLVRRGAREESAKFAAEAATLKTQVSELQQQLRQQAQDVAEQSNREFWSTLTMESPQWEAQNTDPGFLDWLNGADPIYGFTRNEALQRAFATRDAHRVSAIFNEYAQLKQQSGNPLGRQVAPTHTRSSAEPKPNEPRVWTQNDIAAFYNAWRRHEIPDEQAQKIEKDISDAVAAGRVTE